MAKVEGSNPFIRFNESPGDPGLSCVLSRLGVVAIYVGYHLWVPTAACVGRVGDGPGGADADFLGWSPPIRAA
jgi:hypothetical protein